MSQKTDSERAFEEFCQEQGIEYTRIHPGETRQADYEISIKSLKVVAEVKEFVQGKDDKKKRKQEKDEGLAHDCNYAQKVRNKIDKAMPQLKNVSKDIYPTILVLYNDEEKSEMCNSTFHFAITTAMHGKYQVILSISNNASDPPQLKNKKFGGGKKVTSNTNTTLSAIMFLADGYDHPRFARIYHNKYAKNPLPRDLISSSLIQNYELSDKEIGEFQEWILVS
jgi:hypothetical protein